MGFFSKILNLFETDMETDGDEYFDFEVDLNENWEKIDARFSPVNIVISTSNWEGTAAPYSQTIEVEGMTEDINPHVSLISSDDYDTAQSELNEFSKIYKGTSGAGVITFFAKEMPGIDLNVRIKQL